MSVTHVLCFTELYQDCSKLTISDETEYGANAPDRRQDIARVLIGAKMDENQVLAYITSIINIDPLTDLSWTFDSAGDGGYRFFYIDVPLYNGATPYAKELDNVDGTVAQYADIVYHSSNNTFYKAIGTSFSGIQPGVTTGWEASWEVFPITSFQGQLNNTKIIVFRHDDTATCNYDACILKQIDAKTDKELCGICIDSEEFLKVIKMQFLLDAALSNNWQDKVTRSEVIIKQATKKFCC